MNSLETLKQLFFTFLQEKFNLSLELARTITFSLNTDPSKTDFGDISSNAAMVLAKELKTNPRALAQEICQQFQHTYIESITIAGPGFLNFFLEKDFFNNLAHQLFHEGSTFFKLDNTTPKKNFSIEFVSANPTGPLHLGHGRGGIIGDVLGNIVRFLGHNLIKEFYINDAGTQIEKLGNSLKIRYQQLQGHSIELPEDAYHGEYLIELAKEFLKEFGDTADSQPTTIFSSFAQNRLLAHIKQTLKNYGIIFDVWFSERTLHDNDLVSKAIALLAERNFTYTKENAVWFKSTEFGDDKDRVLQRANGQYTYIAADIAYLQNKLQRGFSNVVMILGQDHHSYGTRMKAIIQALGHNAESLDVILYQLVSIKEGGQQVRMSKRAGTIVNLADVTDMVGKDVARFFYLNRKADAHLDFDLDLALKTTEENPVFYVQYAYVRTVSILEKANLHPELQTITENDLKNIDLDEILLLKKIIDLKELLISISTNYQTHLLAYYVIELAHAFHRYYGKSRVIDLENIEKSRSRLACIHILKSCLELCLNLLGLDAPQKM